MMKTFGIVLLFALAGLSCDAPSDSPQAELPPPTTTPAPSVPQTAPEAPLRPDLGQPIPTTTTTLPPGKCAEWFPLAIEVGWPDSEWPTLDRVLWRESRCLPTAHNESDPRHGSQWGSVSLLQLNSFWCLPSRYSERGWLQDQGIVETCDDLFDPRTNLLAGLAIYQYGVERHGYGWGPWSI